MNLIMNFIYQVLKHMETDQNADIHMQLGFMASILTLAINILLMNSILITIVTTVLAGYTMGILIELKQRLIRSQWFRDSVFDFYHGRKVNQNSNLESILDAVVTGSWWVKYIPKCWNYIYNLNQK